MDKPLTKQDVIKIFHEQMEKENRSGKPKVVRHVHDDVDSPKISQSNIIPQIRITSGNITFASKSTYTIGVNFNPSFILFYGEVINADASVKFHVVGSAILGPSYYLQPVNNRTVTVGGLLENITQSSSSYGVEIAGPTFHILSSTFHIVDIEYPLGTIHARMTVKSYSNKSIIVTVDDLDSGWNIIGNFIIS